MLASENVIELASGLVVVVAAVVMLELAELPLALGPLAVVVELVVAFVVSD